MKVFLSGDGDLALALADLIGRAGHELSASDADLTVLVAPADRLRAEVRRVRPGPGDRVLIASRGLEPGTGRRLSSIVSEESACLRVGALGGPILPAEVRRQSPCAGVVGSPFDEVNHLAVAALHSSLCRIYPTRALGDIELAGALVDVLAVAIGVARTMGFGVGTEAMLVTRGVAEGMRLLRAARREGPGGNGESFAGLAGLGELVAVAGVPEHPARDRGAALVKGTPDPGLVAACDALLARCDDLPITRAVSALAAGRLDPGAALRGLLQREVRDEGET